jgi:hypothetical protein
LGHAVSHPVSKCPVNAMIENRPFAGRLRPVCNGISS